MSVSEFDIVGWQARAGELLPLAVAEIEAGRHQRGRRLFQVAEEHFALTMAAYIERKPIQFREKLTAYFKYRALLFGFGRDFPSQASSLIGPYDYIDVLVSLCVGNRSAACALAVNYIDLDETASGQFFFRYSAAIAHAVQDEWDLALSSAESAAAEPFQDYAGRANLLLAVLRREEISLDIWQAALAEFDRNCAGDGLGLPESVVFWEGVGILKLMDEPIDLAKYPGSRFDEAFVQRAMA